MHVGTEQGKIPNFFICSLPMVIISPSRLQVQ